MKTTVLIPIMLRNVVTSVIVLFIFVTTSLAYPIHLDNYPAHSIPLRSYQTKEAREGWCEQDLVTDYINGLFNSSVFEASTAGKRKEGFLLKLRLPLQLKQGTDVLELIESQCYGVSASNFGSGLIFLSATVRGMRRCVRNKDVVVLIQRLCHWHKDMKASEAVSSAISEGYHLPHVVATRVENENIMSISLEELRTTSGYTLVSGSPHDRSLHFVCNSVEKNNHSCKIATLVEWIHSFIETLQYIEAMEPINGENKFSRGMLQTGQQYNEVFADFLGIKGEGYVVGVGDSGIDHDHCFFYDPNVITPINHYNKHHRKIVRYQMMGNGTPGDRYEGHGTHVCGSIAGSTMSPEGNYSEFHGMVPKAKISFWDMSGPGENLSRITNINQYFDISRSDGALTHSNSWGGGTSYDSQCADIDRYVFDHPEFLVLFAAGNSADELCKKQENDLYCDRYTVISPSVSKNVISVGASMGSQDSWKYSNLGNYYLDLSVSLGNNRYRVLLAKGNFGHVNTSMLMNMTIVISNPFTACSSPLNGAEDLSGKILLIHRGDCFFTDKIKRAQKQNVAAVLLINNVNGDPIIMGCDHAETSSGCGVHTPSFMMSKKDGERLVLIIKASSRDDIIGSIVQSDKVDPHKGEDNLSEFSSHGPTFDLRYKPDLVAIGELVISAWSDGNLKSYNCDVWSSQGTSMATPLVAGLATMLREYFNKGMQETGAPDSLHRIPNPSAAFMKAALIHASTPLTGVFDRNSRGDWRTLGKAPTFEQGHGIPILNRTFPTGPNSPVQLFYKDNQEVKNGEMKEYCVEYNGLSDGFITTLVWTDPPSSPGALFSLIYNLDIIVTSPDDTMTFHGNMAPDHRNTTIEGQEMIYGTTENFDVVNNVEKVFLKGAPKGVYRVSVRGTHITSPKAIFAIMATGISTSESCLTRCSSKCRFGYCDKKSNECLCTSGWSGTHCDIPILVLSFPVNGYATVHLEAMHYVHFKIPKLWSTVLRITSLDISGDLDFYVCTEIVTSTQATQECVYSDTFCDTCGPLGPAKNPVVKTLPISENISGLFLSLYAKCCYPVKAKVELLTSRGYSVLSSTVAAFSVDNTTSGIPAFNIEAKPMQANGNDRHGLQLSLLLKEDYQIPPASVLYLRSTSWGNDTATHTSHWCNFTVNTSTCVSSTFSCPAVGHFFTMSIIDQNKNIPLESMHPTAMSVRCTGKWFDNSRFAHTSTRATFRGIQAKDTLSFRITVPPSAVGKKMLIIGEELYSSVIMIKASAHIIFPIYDYESNVSTEIQLHLQYVNATAATIILPDAIHHLQSYKCQNTLTLCNTVKVTLSILQAGRKVGSAVVFVIQGPILEGIALTSSIVEPLSSDFYSNTYPLHVIEVIRAAESRLRGDIDYRRMLFIKGAFFKTPDAKYPLVEAIPSDLWDTYNIKISLNNNSHSIDCTEQVVVREDLLRCNLDISQLSHDPTSDMKLINIRASFDDLFITSGMSIGLEPSGLVSGIVSPQGHMLDPDGSLFIIQGDATVTLRCKMFLLPTNGTLEAETKLGDKLFFKVIYTTSNDIVAFVTNPGARSGVYTFKSVSLFGMNILPRGLLLSVIYQGGGAVIHNVSINTSLHDPRKEVVLLYISGQNLAKIVRRPDTNYVIVKLKPIDSEQSELSCHIERVLSFLEHSPDTFVCQVSTHARGSYYVEVLVGPIRHSIPILENTPIKLPSSKFSFDIELRNAIKSELGLRDNPWVVGIKTEIRISDERIVKYMLPLDHKYVSLFLSEVPCYDQPVKLSKGGLTNDGKSLVFSIIPNIYLRKPSLVYLCLSLWKTHRDIIGMPISGDKVIFYEDIPLMGLSSMYMNLYTAKVSPGTSLSTSSHAVNVEASFIGPLVNFSFLDFAITAKFIPFKEECAAFSAKDATVIPATALKEYRNSSISSVLIIRSNKWPILLAKGRQQRLCIGLWSRRSNISSPQLVDSGVALGCAGYSNVGNNSRSIAGICSNHGKCEITTGVCKCDPWYGGPDCGHACQSGYNGEVCSGRGVCESEGCNCSQAAFISSYGHNRMEYHGTACHIPVQYIHVSSGLELREGTFKHFSRYIAEEQWEGPLFFKFGGPGFTSQLFKDIGAAIDIAVVVPGNTGDISVRAHSSEIQLLNFHSAQWSGGGFASDSSSRDLPNFAIFTIPMSSLTSVSSTPPFFYFAVSALNGSKEFYTATSISIRIRDKKRRRTSPIALIEDGVVPDRTLPSLTILNFFLSDVVMWDNIVIAGVCFVVGFTAMLGVLIRFGVADSYAVFCC